MFKTMFYREIDLFLRSMGCVCQAVDQLCHLIDAFRAILAQPSVDCAEHAVDIKYIIVDPVFFRNLTGKKAVLHEQLDTSTFQRDTVCLVQREEQIGVLIAVFEKKTNKLHISNGFVFQVDKTPVQTVRQVLLHQLIQCDRIEIVRIEGAAVDICRITDLLDRYLSDTDQYDVLEVMEAEDRTPSLSQAIMLKKLSQSGDLDTDRICHLLSQDKPNQREKVSFPYEEIRKYFPDSYSVSDIQKYILHLVATDYNRHRDRGKERDSR